VKIHTKEKDKNLLKISHFLKNSGFLARLTKTELKGPLIKTNLTTTKLAYLIPLLRKSSSINTFNKRGRL